MSTSKVETVCTKASSSQAEILRQLAQSLGLSTSATLAALIPSLAVARVLAIEAPARGGLGEAIENLIGEALLGRLWLSGDWSPELLAEAANHSPGMVAEVYRKHLQLQGERAILAERGVGDLLHTLGHGTKAERFAALETLVRELGRAMKEAGGPEPENKMRLGEIAGAAAKAMMGDGAALAALRAALKLPEPQAHDSAPTEPSAEERKLARDFSPGELLGLLEREPVRNTRRTLTGAFFMACGMRGGEGAREHAAGLFALGDSLIDGKQHAIEAAREWVARHVLTTEEIAE